MPASERRLWCCKQGHVMGEVKKLKTRDAQERALMLYERSVERTSLPTEIPALRGRVVGTMHGIRCTICGSSRDWIIGEDAIQELLKHVTASTNQDVVEPINSRMHDAQRGQADAAATIINTISRAGAM
jgi:hypothetical protein